MTERFVLIGIDGGASVVKAHQVVVTGSRAKAAFRLGEHASTEKHRSIIGFEPPDMQEQLGEYYSGNIQRSGLEVVQAQCYVEAIVAAVGTIAEATQEREVLLGVGFPGLKTAHGRGIAAANNMARAPELLDDIQLALQNAGIKLHHPIARLTSNADNCGVGEEYAAEGMFRGVPNAYHAGCGTGIADAMKLDGKLVPFDDADDWIKKAWQMQSSFGESYEKIASASALIRRYADAVHLTPEEVTACGRFPELAALHGDEIAVHLLTKAAAALAELITDRIRTVRHHRHGTLLERIVIGQRLGELYGKPRYRAVFRDKLDEDLGERIRDMDEERLGSFYLTPDGKLRHGIVVASKLRGASALGAAIDAYRTYTASPD